MKIFTKKEWILTIIAFVVAIVGSFSFMKAKKAQIIASEKAKEFSGGVKEENKNQLKPHDNYNFSQPTARVELPEILHEVSGLTDVDAQTLALVQDENGIIFLYDWQQKTIKRQFDFGKDDDYEGITKANNILYVLRSDGKLFEISDFQNDDFKVKEYDTNLPVKDNEGLGFDAKNNRLLIAGKSEPKDDEYKDTRTVFAFDLERKAMIEKPVFIFREDKIKAFGKKHNLAIAKKDLDINPSGIAVHPITGKLYVLSSRDELIYIFNQNSEVEAVHSLDRKIYTQPEGITFLENGDMFISNEGRKNKPSLLLLPFEND